MLIYIMFLIGMITYCLNRKHLLSMLLSMEFVILSLYWFMYGYMSLYGFEFYYCMMFMIMSVCEGVLGLSILVLMIRTHGNDFFQSFNILW